MDPKRGLILVLVVLLIVINLIHFAVITTITGQVTTEGNVSICIVRPPSIDTIPDQSATVDTLFTYQVGVTFYGDNSSTAYYDNTALFDINQSGYISFTPAGSQAGSSTIEIIAEDRSSSCLAVNSSDSFLLTISAAAAPGDGGGGGAGGGGGGAAAAGEAAALPLTFTMPFEYEEEQVKEIQAGDRITFPFGGSDHTISIVSIGLDTITVYISSTQKTVTLQVGEAKKIDVDDDTVADLYLKLQAIRRGKATLILRSLRQGFTLSDELIKVTVKETQALEKKVTATSDWPTTLIVDVTNPLENVLSIYPSIFSLPAEGQQEMLLVFNPAHQAVPDVYPTTLTITGTNFKNLFEKYITLVLEVQSEKVTMDASLDVTAKTLSPGEPLSAVITIFNLERTGPATATLVYAISDLKNNLIYTEEETITVEEQASLSKIIPLSPGIASGQYVFSIKVLSGESVATATELFTVVGAPSVLAGLAAPILNRPLLAGLLPVALSIVVVIILLALYLLHRKVKRKTLVKERVVERTVEKTIIKPRVIIKRDTAALERKLLLLKEAHDKGFLTEKTYRESREKVQRLLGGKK